MSIPELLRAHERHHLSHDGKIHVWAAAGTPRGTSIDRYLALGRTCATNGISMTMHCAESPKDRVIYQDAYGCSAMEFVRDAELCPQPVTASKGCDPKSHCLLLAHMVNLDQEIDISLLASTQTSVAHNPTSNLKLASGVAPIPSMLSHTPPVNVALGTDGAPCCNHYDMIREMHLAGILHKGVNHDASLIPAEVALEMATINGARALGMEGEIGSLEIGKKADIVVLDPYGRGGLGAAPWSNVFIDHGVSPVTTVVHGLTGRDVDTTMVNGEILVENGVLAMGGQDKEREIVELAQRAAKGIIRRCNADRDDEAKVGGKLRSSWRYA